MPTPRAGYRTKDGIKVPSVTTILGRFKDSGGLIKWAYKQGREHENLAMRNLPAPTHLYDVTEKAAAAGTIAHDLIEADILNIEQDEIYAKYPYAMPDVLARAENAYRQYERWRDNSRIKVTATEKGLVSELHKFGGTLDAIGRDADNQVVLLDWKTSNTIYGEYLIQLAAYSLLLEENFEPDFHPRGWHILRVAKESADFAHHYYGNLDQEKKAFLLMRELYDIVYAVEKRA